MAVAKPELGIKRQCAHCGAKFYDLGKSPILCPKCGTVYEVTAAPARRQAAAKPAPVAEEIVPVAEAETVSLEEVAEQENKSASGKGTPPDLEGEDDEVEVGDSEDDTFLAEEEEEPGDVSDLIGEGIDKKEEET